MTSVTESEPATISTAPAASGPHATAALLRALVAGLVASLALGLTLLTWALSLMFMLGLFFFMLFGLLVGSIMFRMASRSRPLPRRGVMAVTGIVVAAGWLTAIGKECWDFQDDFVNAVVNRRTFEKDRLYIPQGGYDRVCGEVHDFIVAHLKSEYPPGGALGYLRYTWSGDGVMLDIPSQPRKIPVAPRVAPWVWWVRVLAALPLFFFTTFSVTSGLARLPSESELRRSAQMAGF